MPARTVSALEMGVDLAPALQVRVPEVWLRADERMRDLAYRVDSSRTRRRIAACLEREPVALDRMEGLEFSGSILPHGEGETLTVELRAAAPSPECEDQFRFELAYDASTLGYEIRRRSKLVREVWGGGCVPDGLRQELLPAVVSCECVSRSASRFGHAISVKDVAWDWVPEWAYGDVALPDGKGVLEGLMRERIPGGGASGFAVLATWSLAVEERPSTSGGVRVRMVLDPDSQGLVRAWEEDWRVLY